MQIEWSAEMERSAESSPNAIFTDTTGCPLLSAKATSITSCHGGQWRWRAGTKEIERERNTLYIGCFELRLTRTCIFMRGHLSVEVNLCNRIDISSFTMAYAHTYPEISCTNIYTHAAFKPYLWLETVCLGSCATFGLWEAAINGESRRKSERYCVTVW